MTEMFGEAWSPMSVPDLAPDDDDDGKPHQCNLETYAARIFESVGFDISQSQGKSPRK